jgi:multiple sugar transport system substrate-binding protein
MMSIRNSCARTAWPGLMGVMTCLLAFSLSGCKGAAPTPEPVTITFACRDMGAEHYEALIPEFNEQYPHITVNLRPETEDGLINLEAQGADVRPVWQAMFDPMQERGDILALDPFVEQDASLDLSDFYPAALQVFTIDGEIWAIPFGANPVVMYYNQDLFDQYDVPYPVKGWTWDDFLSAALAIRDPEAGVFGYASNVGRVDALWLVYQHGGRIYDDIQHPSRVTFDDPLTIEALEWYARLYHEYDVAPTPQQALRAFGSPESAVERAILEGKVGIWSYDFVLQGGRGRAGWPMRWGMVSLPRDTQAATGGICAGFAVSSQTQHSDAAWKWVAFLSRQPWEYLVPVRRSIVESAEYKRQVGEDVAALAGDSVESALFYSPRVYSRFEGSREIFFEAVDRIISGAMTPQEAMDWAQREAESR